MADRITVSAEQVALLRKMRFDWDDEIEFGAVSSDPKRPFGNSDVDRDIEEILGLPEDSLSWEDAKRIAIPLAALVEHIVRHADLEALVGVEVSMPWRAARRMR